MLRVSSLTLTAALVIPIVWTGCDSHPTLPVVEPGAKRTVDPLVIEHLQKFVEAVKAKPKDAVDRGRLGMVYEANGLFDLAGQCYDQAATLAPRQGFWTHRRAICLAMSGATDEARKLLRSVVEKDPSYAPTWHRLATLALESGDLSEARSAATHVTDLRPDSHAAMVTLAECHLRSDQVEDAIRILEKVREQKPSYIYAVFILGRAYQKDGRPETEYSQLIERGTGALPEHLTDPRASEIPSHRAGASDRINFSGTLIDQGNPSAAVSVLQTVIARYPEEYAALVNLGIAQQQLKQYKAAIDNFDKAIGIEKDNFRAYLAKASCLIIMQEFSQALAAADKACRYGPQEWRCYYTRGRAAIMLGEALVVQDSLEQAERLAPNVGDIKLALFEYHHQSGNLEVAREKLDQASELSPNNPVIWVNLAMLHTKAGRFQQAHRAMDKAKKLAPNRPEVKNAIRRLRQLEKAGQ